MSCIHVFCSHDAFQAVPTGGCYERKEGVRRKEHPANCCRSIRTGHRGSRNDKDSDKQMLTDAVCAEHAKSMRTVFGTSSAWTVALALSANCAWPAPLCEYGFLKYRSPQKINHSHHSEMIIANECR